MRWSADATGRSSDYACSSVGGALVYTDCAMMGDPALE
jgi:hypothetical protein